MEQKRKRRTIYELYEDEQRRRDSERVMSRKDYMLANNMTWLIGRNGRPTNSNVGYDAMYQQDGAFYKLFVKANDSNEYRHMASATLDNGRVKISDLDLSKLKYRKRLERFLNTVIGVRVPLTLVHLIDAEDKWMYLTDGRIVSD